ncbi:hypothetical protein [Rugamonas apoptosis]|uniref:GAF domain-containing protein n=1 Tax=Rugamonas apoptosis TaxID=2758570 RepID=A0A7W2F737_9BURK|nr:hypothetical protein [Rugamonas apoptosis]MBA5686322.1 hypothetical protein [Rugamonas apoptosis]
MIKKISNFFASVFLFPLFGGITTITGILAGYLGSLWTKEIKESVFQIYHPHIFGLSSVSFDGKSSLFWFFSAIAGLSLSATFWAQTKAGNETNEAIKNSLSRLMTLPPEDFLLNYRDFMILSNSVESTLPVPMQLVDLEQAIRIQLSSICSVCARFDSNGGRTRFAANVMMFIPAGGGKFNNLHATLQTETRCIESAVSIANLHGVLRLELNLSASEGSNKADPKLSSLCLPIPKGVSNPLIYIPGAPLAFAQGKTQVYRNQSDLIEQVENNRLFSSTVLNELKDVLGAQNESVKCLMCFPLFSDSTTGPSSVIGVLNIHKSIEDEYIQRKMENLEPLLAPILRNLEILLWLLP